MQDMWAQFLGQEESPDKKITTNSSILAGKSHGQRSLAGYSPWGHKESDTTNTHIYTPGLQLARLLCPRDFTGRILEQVAISFSRESFQPRDRTHVSCIGRQILYH